METRVLRQVGAKENWAPWDGSLWSRTRPQSSGGCQEVRTVAAVSLTGVRLAGRLPLRDPFTFHPTAISPKQILQYLPLPWCLLFEGPTLVHGLNLPPSFSLRESLCKGRDTDHGNKAFIPGSPERPTPFSITPALWIPQVSLINSTAFTWKVRILLNPCPRPPSPPSRSFGKVRRLAVSPVCTGLRIPPAPALSGTQVSTFPHLALWGRNWILTLRILRAGGARSSQEGAYSKLAEFSLLISWGRPRKKGQ